MNKYKKLAIASLVIAGISLTGTSVNVSKAYNIREQVEELTATINEKYDEIKSSPEYQEFYSSKVTELCDLVASEKITTDKYLSEIENIKSNYFVREQFLDSNNFAEMRKLENEQVELTREMGDHEMASVVLTALTGASIGAAIAMMINSKNEEDYMYYSGGFRE